MMSNKKSEERLRPIDVPQEVIDMLCRDFGIEPDQAVDLVMLLQDEAIAASKTK